MGGVGGLGWDGGVCGLRLGDGGLNGFLRRGAGCDEEGDGEGYYFFSFVSSLGLVVDSGVIASGCVWVAGDVGWAPRASK